MPLVVTVRSRGLPAPRPTGLTQPARVSRLFGDYDHFLSAHVSKAEDLIALEKSLRETPDHRTSLLLGPCRDLVAGTDAVEFLPNQAFPFFGYLEIALAPGVRNEVRKAARAQRRYLKQLRKITDPLVGRVRARLTPDAGAVQSFFSLGPYDFVILIAAGSLNDVVAACEPLWDVRGEDVRESFSSLPQDWDRAHLFSALHTSVGCLSDDTELKVVQRLADAPRVEPVVRLQSTPGHDYCWDWQASLDAELFPEEGTRARFGHFDYESRSAPAVAADAATAFHRTCQGLRAIETKVRERDTSFAPLRTNTTWRFPAPKPRPHPRDALCMAALVDQSTATNSKAMKTLGNARQSSCSRSFSRVLAGYMALLSDPVQAACVSPLSVVLETIARWLDEEGRQVLTRLHAVEDLDKLCTKLATIIHERSAYTSQSLKASVSFRLGGAAQEICLALERAAMAAAEAFQPRGQPRPPGQPQPLLVHFELCNHPVAVTYLPHTQARVRIIELEDHFLAEASMFAYVIHNACHAIEPDVDETLGWARALAESIACAVTTRFAGFARLKLGKASQSALEEDIVAECQRVLEDPARGSFEARWRALRRYFGNAHRTAAELYEELGGDDPEGLRERLDGTGRKIRRYFDDMAHTFEEVFADLHAGVLLGEAEYWESIQSWLDHPRDKDRRTVLTRCWGLASPGADEPRAELLPLIDYCRARVARLGTEQRPGFRDIPNHSPGAWLTWLVETWV